MIEFYEKIKTNRHILFSLFKMTFLMKSFICFPDIFTGE